ncbi:MAG: Unknown protein [uncultured Thiotrichaceae bacterium]|uniref:Peptidase S54 rhomboid domain-containing protein n=1 Tax=uncultured Thiotrichaceae bacterium TaxID=298394 RepID=A0A6S6SRJ0_9GAMM|nr:MAG: Unknown protein [uncultured Thiotrichaceae bacterium]
MNSTPLIPRPLLFFAIGFSLLMLALQSVQPNLLYQRESILAGEAWRLWTGNFVHTNITHLALNLAGFWVFLLLCGQTQRLKFLIFSIIFCAFIVGIGLFLFNPQIIWYAGFSGIQYGLFLAGGIVLVIESEKVYGSALLMLVIGKMLMDAFTPTEQLSQSLIEAPVIHQAHWYGAIAGIVSTFPRIFQAIQHQPAPHV